MPSAAMQSKAARTPLKKKASRKKEQETTEWQTCINITNHSEKQTSAFASVKNVFTFDTSHLSPMVEQAIKKAFLYRRTPK
jgi:hypothetical protein